MNGYQPTNTPNDDEDTDILPVIETPCIHNNTGFCYDLSHECHENQESIQELHQDYQDGLVSDADRAHLSGQDPVEGATRWHAGNPNRNPRSKSNKPPNKQNTAPSVNTVNTP
jgi:hypothetical protein